MKKGLDALGELQQIRVYGKSEIENRKENTKNATTLMNNRLKNNSIPLTNTSGELMVMKAPGVYDWVPMGEAYTKYRGAIVTNSRAVELAKNNAPFSSNNYVSNIANTEGLPNVYKEMDTHFDRFKGTGDEETFKKLLLESTKNGDSSFITSNKNQLNRQLGDILNELSYKAKNTLNIMAYKELPNHLNKQEIKDYEAGKFTKAIKNKLNISLYTVLLNHAKEFYNFKVNKVSNSNSHDIKDETMGSWSKTLSGGYGKAKSTVAGETSFGYNVGEDLWKEGRGGQLVNGKFENAKMLRYANKNAAVIVGGSDDKEQAAEDVQGVLYGNSYAMDAKVVAEFPMIDGKPVTNFDDDEEKNADILASIMSARENIKIANKKLEDENTSEEDKKRARDEINKANKIINEYFPSARVTFAPVLISHVVSAKKADSGAITPADEDTLIGNIKDAIYPNSDKSERGDIKDAYIYKMIIPLNPTINVLAYQKVTANQYHKYNNDKKKAMSDSTGISFNRYNGGNK